MWTLSIDRTSLSLTPLVLSGEEDGTTWGILAGWQQPAEVPEITWAAAPRTHGAEPTHWKFQQALMSGDVSPDVSSPEALATAIAELKAAIHRTEYEVTAMRKGINFGVWRCFPGTLTPSPLDYVDLRDDRQVFSLSIPCHPVAS